MQLIKLATHQHLSMRFAFCIYCSRLQVALTVWCLHLPSDIVEFCTLHRNTFKVTFPRVTFPISSHSILTIYLCVNTILYVNKISSCNFYTIHVISMVV